jgi:hypothetical protein
MPINVLGGAGGGGSELNTATVVGNATGTISSGDAGIIYVDLLKDNESLKIKQAYLVSADGSPAPSGIDLIIATLDNSGGGTKQVEIISSDGSLKIDETESLGEYTNSSGGPQTVAVLMDNGHFGSGTGEGSGSEELAGGMVGESGSSSDFEAPTVITLDSNVVDVSADLSGEITDLGGYSRAREIIEYKPKGDNLYVTNDNQDLVNQPQSYTKSIGGLDADTEYKWRAVTTYGGDLSITRGDVKTFTTGDPIIENFERTDPLSDYTFSSGDSSAFSVQQNGAKDGDNYLLFDYADKAAWAATEDRPQLPISRGDNLVSYTYPEGNDTRGNTKFFVDVSAQTGYILILEYQGVATDQSVPGLEFRRHDGDLGSSAEILDTVEDIRTPTNEWIKWDIQTSSSTMTAEAIDASGNSLGTLSSGNTVLDSGGIGFGNSNNSSNSNVKFDYYKKQTS